MKETPTPAQPPILLTEKPSCDHRSHSLNKEEQINSSCTVTTIQTCYENNGVKRATCSSSTSAAEVCTPEISKEPENYTSPAGQDSADPRLLPVHMASALTGVLVSPHKSDWKLAEKGCSVLHLFRNVI